MRIEKDAGKALSDGFDAISKQFNLPGRFPDDVLKAAESVTMLNRWRDMADRLDAQEIPYVTLDPATSTDLDQAFYLAQDGKDIVLSYALADISCFVPFDGPVEQEAWKRGVTIYGMPSKIPLYPSVISQGAASLLPDGPRPAVQVMVSIAPDGTLRLRSVERVVCASRAKLDYATVDLDSIAYLEEFADRMWLNESKRGSVRFDFPQQEVVTDESCPGGIRLELRAPLFSETVNSSLSLAVNMALGDLLRDAKTGLFRVMDEPEQRAMERLRREAHALGINWFENESIKDVQRRLDPEDIVHQRFLLNVRRAGGRASYAVFSDDKIPWHAAVGATYAHATAPMRRLADRYVLDLAWLLMKGQPIPQPLLDRIDRLPVAMASGDGRARAVDKAVIDLVEAVSLQNRIGEILDAEVVDAYAGIVQTVDSAIRSRAAKLVSVKDGDRVRVRIDKADPTTRQIVLTAV
jgi:exoribonuclease R